MEDIPIIVIAIADKNHEVDGVGIDM